MIKKILIHILAVTVLLFLALVLFPDNSNGGGTGFRIEIILWLLFVATVVAISLSAFLPWTTLAILVIVGASGSAFLGMSWLSDLESAKANAVGFMLKLADDAAFDEFIETLGQLGIAAYAMFAAAVVSIGTLIALAVGGIGTRIFAFCNIVVGFLPLLFSINAVPPLLFLVAGGIAILRSPVARSKTT